MPEWTIEEWIEKLKEAGIEDKVYIGPVGAKTLIGYLELALRCNEAEARLRELLDLLLDWWYPGFEVVADSIGGPMSEREPITTEDEILIATKAKGTLPHCDHPGCYDTDTHYDENHRALCKEHFVSSLNEKLPPRLEPLPLLEDTE